MKNDNSFIQQIFIDALIIVIISDDKVNNLGRVPDIKLAREQIHEDEEICNVSQLKRLPGAAFLRPSIIHTLTSDP